MNLSMKRDMGAYLKGFNALNPVTVTAGTTADGNQYDGHIYDRRSPGGTNSDLYESMKVIVPYDASIATTGNTATFSVQVQHSTSTASTAFSDYSDIDGTTANTKTETHTTVAGTSVPSGVVEGDFDLSGANRYVRIQVTATLAATATDTVDMGGIMVMGGSDFPPAD